MSKRKLMIGIYGLIMICVSLIILGCGSKKSNETILSVDAINYVGQEKSIEDKIITTHNSGKACFLNFGQDYRNCFSAVIFSNKFHMFPEKPENYYNGKMVRVTGIIKLYKGKAEIILEEPGQIKIVE